MVMSSQYSVSGVCVFLKKKGAPGDGKIDEDRAREQIYYAIDKGINYFDTAMPYHMGASELFLGKVFANGHREKIKLATKISHFHINAPEDMEKCIRAQLNKLITDYIDYYLVHTLDKKSWAKMKSFGILEFLESLKKDQRIINTGFSYHGDKDTFREIIDAYDWDVCQIQYNYLDVQNQAGRRGLKYAHEKGVSVIVMEPLRGGNIAGNVPPDVQKLWDQAEIKRSPAEWALRWIWNHPEVTCVLSGMNEETHIDENINVASNSYPESLDDNELQLVNSVRKKYLELMKIGCTGCNYCMLCPSGVNIPSCFESYNSGHMFGNLKRAKMMYLIFVSGALGEPAYASLCEKCGDGEEACPQNLPIQTTLENVASDFEGKWFKQMSWLIRKVVAFQRWKDLRRANN